MTDILPEDGVGGKIVKKADLPGFNIGEAAKTGVSFSHGRILEESKVDLVFPYSTHTYKEMSYDSAVSSALGIIEVLVSRADWKIEEPQNATTQEKKWTETCNSMLEDMERPWSEYVQEFISYLQYGHSEHVIVYKRRKGEDTNAKYKSKYNDNVLGWAKLKPLSQATIDRWIYDDVTDEFVGLRQNLAFVRNDTRMYLGSNKKFNKSEYLIPKAKFLHFRWNPKRNNPEGQSPLRNCYLSWRYKTTIEEYEAMGISRDLAGMPVVSIPVEYMATDADPEQKAVYEYFKTMINNIHANESAGVIMPSMVDPISKVDMFSFKLEGVQGGKQYNTNEIINRYENKILMAFFADILKMGQDSVGSFALSDNKNNLLAFMVESQLKIIANVLNKHLIPQTFKLNGWKTSNYPKFVYSDIEDADLEAISKFIQRTVAVGAVEVDKPLSDYLRGLLDLPTGDKEKPLDTELSPNGASRSGDGLKSGMPNGTGDSKGDNGDNSSGNKENASSVIGNPTYQYDPQTNIEREAFE